MNHIEVIIDSEMEKPLQGIDSEAFRDRIVKFCLQILMKTNVKGGEFGILFTDDEGMRRLNKQWRQRDESTDVLSFAQDCKIPLAPLRLDNELTPMGDVVISYETVVRNSRERGISFDEELRRVIIHGLLHLEGMDHLKNNYETGMLKLQEVLLNDSRWIIEQDR